MGAPGPRRKWAYADGMSSSISGSSPGAAGRRPTMRDVAREAGVSTALVSIVFRDAPGASEQTRKHVREAAGRIGYVVDERARLLRRSRSTDIGVMFQTGQPFHHQLLDDLYSAIEGAGGTVILSGVSSERDERTALAGLVSYRCGAVIVLGAALRDQQLLEAADGIPLVSIARPTGCGIDWVSSDDRRGMSLAVGHLADLGHRDVLFAAAEDAAGAAERHQGFEEAVAENGLHGSIEIGGTTELSGADLALRLLERERLPSSVIAFNDRAALGLMDVLVRRGVSIPQDISIVGSDDSEIASRHYVDLTTIAQDTRRLAEGAAVLARERMQSGPIRSGPGAMSTESMDAQGRVVPVELVVRGTTGPPRADGGGPGPR